MKVCPKCAAEYSDASLNFCLEDGEWLQSADAEPATAILHETAAPNETATRNFSQTTGQTVVLPNEPSRSGVNSRSKRNSIIAGLVGILLVTALGIGSYWLYGRNSTKQIESIAVMPFVNESGNPEVEYLSDGMTETLIRSLSNLADLDVKPRSAVFRYKGKNTEAGTIAKELNVQAILTGNVVQRGEQLTLNLELVDALKNRVIWSEQYIRKTSDLVSLQSSIAKDVSAKLTARLSGAEESKVTKAVTTDAEAYQAYLKGRYYWNRRTAETINKAIEQFKAATDRDPNYALAYAGLADCYIVLNQYAGVPTSETLPKATAYAERAIGLDPLLAEPHASLGQVYRQSWRWEDSEREYRRSLEINPNYATAYHWYSLFLKDQGRFDESAVVIKRAKELDPLSSVISINISEMYNWQNDHKASIQNSLKIIELDPNYGDAYRSLGMSYLKLGREGEAFENLQKATELSGRASYFLSDTGYAYGVSGKRTEAIAIAKELEEKYARQESPAQYVAAVYAGLGEIDRAFDWLEKDFKNKAALTDLRWAIPFEPLRDDPRFKDLLKRMNLPE